MRKTRFVLVTLGCCLVLSCSAPKETAPAPAAQEYNTVATIKDIMDSLVDPSADHIWQSVGAEITAQGVVDKAPRNSDEWKEERRHAIRLVEAANLLVMPGRRVAQPGEKSENPGIELSPEEIETGINASRPTFLRLAREFQASAIKILNAADQKNLDALLELGADLDERCENCHKTYWYPNDPAFKDQPRETDKDKAEGGKK